MAMLPDQMAFLLDMITADDEEEEEEELALGYRFYPTDQQLIIYLYAKVFYGDQIQQLNLPKKLKIVGEEVLYGDKAPYEIFNVEPSSPSKDFYCFTLARKKFSNTGDRISRTVAGKGSWQGTQSPKKIYHSQRPSLLIGYDRALNFAPLGKPKTPNGQKCSWIMHQYTLASYPTQDANEFWVLCKIRYNPPKDNQIPCNPPNVVEECPKKRTRTSPVQSNSVITSSSNAGQPFHTSGSEAQPISVVMPHTQQWHDQYPGGQTMVDTWDSHSAPFHSHHDVFGAWDPNDQLNSSPSVTHPMSYSDMLPEIESSFMSDQSYYSDYQQDLFSAPDMVAEMLNCDGD